jgi:hypothetical protein
MKTKLTKPAVEQVIAGIQALDLDPIKLKLMNPEEGHGWSREYADSMEVAYKRFLTLSVTHPEETLAPAKDVDRFWHGHILDTLKYAEDCEKVFGYFLHHFPYFGMRGDEDAANLAAAAERTRELYQQEFGSSENERAAWCGAAIKQNAAWCGATIEPQSAAWCGAAIAPQGAAWCGAAIKPQDAAWCGAAIKPQNAAWCGAAVKAESAAWCGAAIKPQSALSKLNPSVRPTLASV